MLTVIADIASDVVLQEDVEDALMTKSGFTLLQSFTNSFWTWLRVKSRVIFLHYVGWYMSSKGWFHSVLQTAYGIIYSEGNTQAQT
ncbi:hypothetical protein EON65_02760 [archaeon]|nr:MAG: hypothetical protein EON65_02760 [archaeon]